VFVAGACSVRRVAFAHCLCVPAIGRLLTVMTARACGAAIMRAFVCPSMRMHVRSSAVLLALVML